MKTATVRTLRNDYAKLLRRVETGEEIAISRRGRIVARLVPAHSDKTGVDWAASAARRLTAGTRPLSAKARDSILKESQGRW